MTRALFQVLLSTFLFACFGFTPQHSLTRNSIEHVHSSKLHSQIIELENGKSFELHEISDDSESGSAFCEFPSDKDLEKLPNGLKGGYKVMKTYQISFSHQKPMLIQEALTTLDPINYPTLSRARKACRKGSIIIHNGPIQNGEEHQAFSSKSKRARVGVVVNAGDVIGVQIMMGTFKKKRCYPNIMYSRPRFSLPILYEDDHLAIVDKPAQIAMYSTRESKSGSTSRRTIRDILPWTLTPPHPGTHGNPLRRPIAVHRLDTPTNGVVVVAKTKTAMDSLYHQFQSRKTIKSYIAIVNGHPQGNDYPGKSENGWNIIDYPLGGKHAVTRWRVMKTAKSLNAKDGLLTQVEVQPKTGRYHQIRRHFMLICRRPLVGDKIYAGLLQAPRFLRNGLYLCSNGITLEHPYYNTSIGRKEWETIVKNGENYGDFSELHLSDDGQNKVMLTIRKEPPKRFEKLMWGEESWANQKAMDESIPERLISNVKERNF